MDCKEVEIHATALAEFKLTAAEQAELESHIQRCTRCKSIVNRIAELVSEIGHTESVELSPQFWPGLYRRIQAYDADRAEGRSRWTVRRRRLRPVLGLTSLILGIWAGIHLGNAYALRKLSPAEEVPASSSLEETVLYPETLEGLPRGSLSALLIFDSRDAEPRRSER